MKGEIAELEKGIDEGDEGGGDKKVVQDDDVKAMSALALAIAMAKVTRDMSSD